MSKREFDSFCMTCEHLIQKKLKAGVNYFGVRLEGSSNPNKKVDGNHHEDRNSVNLLDDIIASRDRLVSEMAPSEDEGSTLPIQNRFYKLASFNHVGALDRIYRVSLCKLALVPRRSCAGVFEENILEASLAFCQRVNESIVRADYPLLQKLQGGEMKMDSLSESNRCKRYFGTIMSTSAYSRCLASLLLFLTRVSQDEEIERHGRNETEIESLINVFNGVPGLLDAVRELQKSPSIITVNQVLQAVISQVSCHSTGYKSLILHWFLVVNHLTLENEGSCPSAIFGNVGTIRRVCSMLLFALKGSVLLTVLDCNGDSVAESNALRALELGGNLRGYWMMISISSLARRCGVQDVMPSSTISFAVNPTSGMVDTSTWLINGTILSLDDIISGSKVLLNNLHSSKERLCLGFKLQEDLLSLIHDNLNSRECNYWFFVDPRSIKLKHVSDRYIKHVLSALFTVNTTGSGEHNLSPLDGTLTPITRFLVDCDVFIRQLFTSEHLFAGSPARCSEKIVMRLYNTVVSSEIVRRNVFYMQHYSAIMILASHNKASKKQRSTSY